MPSLPKDKTTDDLLTGGQKLLLSQNYETWQQPYVVFDSSGILSCDRASELAWVHVL